MRHAAMYHGAFERNFGKLKAGATTFEGSDGAQHELAPWPKAADGIHIGYMEKPGKKFFVVRVQFGATDVVLKKELVIDLARHFGYGKRLGPEPTIVEDDGLMVTLLEDVIRVNPEQSAELMTIRRQIRDRHAKP
jgi:hypothetical protein